MKHYLSRITRITIAPQAEPMFSEAAIQVELEDEAAGEYITIMTQAEGKYDQKVSIDFDEWPHVVEAVKTIIKESKRNTP